MLQNFFAAVKSHTPILSGALLAVGTGGGVRRWKKQEAQVRLPLVVVKSLPRPPCLCSLFCSVRKLPAFINPDGIMALNSNSADTDLLELKSLQLDVQTLQQQRAADRQEFIEFSHSVNQKFAVFKAVFPKFSRVWMVSSQTNRIWANAY